MLRNSKKRHGELVESMMFLQTSPIRQAQGDVCRRFLEFPVSLSFFFGIFILLIGCQSVETVTLHGPDEKIVIHVEVADDSEERQKGLMYRTALPEGHGMLFVFDEPTMQSFWMKNTRIPLDILFFDAGGQFVSSTSMDPCIADPCRVFPSREPAKYALEVPAGFLKRHTIDPSWILQVHIE